MDTSPFIRLSPELRNLIYEYTFTSRYKHHLTDGNCQHSLTKTCRQIRQEALGMFYTHTRFNAHLDDRPPAPLLSWLKVIGLHSCLLIRELNIWGLHDVCLTLHSLPAARAFMAVAEVEEQLLFAATATGVTSSSRETQSRAIFELRHVTAQSCRVTDYLADVVDCLEGMEGLVVRQICVVSDDGDRVECELGLTSAFAMTTDEALKEVVVV
ncbi:hypothetical protein K431DRAFT_284131 [Polychaeton citri CBS 116435]|uniref:F-box domain-containing protein n=1 Tax=Polychaeton citri CBS 116435 TaxID=1314669 RepID=A0A9P4UNB7_9PEZI|nr:hypothetical protein K431DRAFT_284131 [Polychaeton citri CBS 116435]